ncbi:substrate-binding domain-containing protein [Aquiluna borgnonia]|jgi:D-xylose transport system substrate-binding protein|uniref:Substrate-binding domain-containing protein n=1 Tax=Aquiluna borgnonia TaxID=2499157 RepID=A0A7D4TRZ4_9MICO|nr:substrate-binding domain-containing protein [Aquiluna borgnonia]QKJ25693.1 substrate-binding domain-containing protein [Aquiluna borgnonia]
MKKIHVASLSAIAAASLLLAGCASTTATTEETSAATEETSAAAPRACVILPDADAGTRWETGDRPALEAGLTAAGFEADIQNALADTAKFATIADAQLAQGCGVMVLVDYQGAGVAVAEKAKAAGVPVIAYDRPIAGADYYVSFDNFTVGALQGQMIVDGLAAAGKDITTASIIYSSGDPADGNAAMFLDGALSVLDAAGAKAAFTMEGTWDGAKAGTLFEQAFTAVGGKVDAVLAPNDNNAASIIAILDKNGLTVPVSGQDASTAGLQNVLLGKQYGTVYKPFSVEVDAALTVINALLTGGTVEANKTLEDGTPYIAVDPIIVTADKVKDVVANGDASAADLCTAEVADACATYGVE